jgi:hypothetical protein
VVHPFIRSPVGGEREEAAKRRVDPTALPTGADRRNTDLFVDELCDGLRERKDAEIIELDVRETAIEVSRPWDIITYGRRTGKNRQIPGAFEVKAAGTNLPKACSGASDGAPPRSTIR